MAQKRKSESDEGLGTLAVVVVTGLNGRQFGKLLDKVINIV